MGGIYRQKSVRFLCAVVLAITMLLAGCSSFSSNNSAANDAGLAQQSKASEQGSAGNYDSVGQYDGDAEIAAEPTFGGDTAEDLGFNRKLIYKANITLEVKDYGKAQSEIRNMVHLAQGYLVNFSENNTEYERSGTFIMKVPSQGFMGMMSKLEALAPDHYQSSIDGQDVTEEYVDLESRLKAKQVVEDRLLSFMEKATGSSALVEFSNELAKVQEEIERIKGRMRYLDQNVEYSTIEVRVYEPSNSSRLVREEDRSFGDRLVGAVQGALKGISIVFQELIIFLVAALPVLLVLGIIGSPFILWYIRKQRKTLPPPPVNQEQPRNEDEHE